MALPETLSAEPYILSNMQVDIPTHMPCGAPITFGVELEGVIETNLPINNTEGNPFSPRDCFDPCSKALMKCLDRIGQSGFWSIKQDETIIPPPRHIGMEIISEGTSGTRGLLKIASGFETLHDSGFATNESCGLHGNVSLGWKKKGEDLEGLSMRYAVNVLRSYQDNRMFFHQFVPPHRWKRKATIQNHPILTPEEWDAIQYAPDLFNHFDRREIEVNPRNIIRHGTIENRLKPAEDYKNSIGYIQFVILFTIESALDPCIRPEDVLIKYGMKMRSGRNTTTSYRKAALISILES